MNNPLNFSQSVFQRIQDFRRAKQYAMDGLPMKAIYVLRGYGYSLDQAKSYLRIGAIMRGSNA